MAITKHDIDNVSLTIVNEGYDPEEVDLLLERIGDEVDNFNRALVEAASRIDAAEGRANAAEQQAAQSAQIAQSSQGIGQNTASEHQIAQALIAAQKSADELRESAKNESDKACREAEKRARDIVRDALSEKQRILDEVDRLRESTESFRSEYMGVLGRFSSEAQKVMPKLGDASPNVEQEKKATADAIQAIKDADAAFEVPKSEPEPVFETASYTPVTFPSSSSQNNSAYAAAPAAAQVAGQAAFMQSTQPAFDFDEDLDIEEID